MNDTNTLYQIQQFMAAHPELQQLPFYQHHASALMVAIAWAVREYHTVGGWPAVQSWFDNRQGGAIVWLFKALFGSKRVENTIEQVLKNATDALNRPTPAPTISQATTPVDTTKQN